MSKYCKEISMEEKGKVYKFTGIYGIIRPDTWGVTRRDVLFIKADYNFKIGDRVVYDQYENNGRRYTKNIQNLNT